MPSSTEFFSRRTHLRAGILLRPADGVMRQNVNHGKFWKQNRKCGEERMARYAGKAGRMKSQGVKADMLKRKDQIR